MNQLKKSFLTLCTLATFSIGVVGCQDSKEEQERHAWFIKKGQEYKRQEEDIQDKVDSLRDELEAEAGERSWRELERERRKGKVDVHLLQHVD